MYRLTKEQKKLEGGAREIAILENLGFSKTKRVVEVNSWKEFANILIHLADNENDIFPYVNFPIQQDIFDSMKLSRNKLDSIDSIFCETDDTYDHINLNEFLESFDVNMVEGTQYGQSMDPNNGFFFYFFSNTMELCNEVQRAHPNTGCYAFYFKFAIVY